jgi:hypothetical protein
MAKQKANPLGHLEFEIVHNTTQGSEDANYVGAMQDQAPVHTNASGNETFRADAKKPTSRADVEKRRMHIDSGADLKGVAMYKEFAPGDKGAKDFTSDKSA